MDLTTKYMGIELANPLVVGACPLSDDIGVARGLEDAGAAAIVMRSLFMEQILRDQLAAHELEAHHDSFAEALSFFPEPASFSLGPDEYLDQVRKLKDALGIPVVGSLNGISCGTWVRYAKLIEQAGADALELNVYYLPLLTDEASADVEKLFLDVLTSVKEQVGIPLAIKLTPFFSALGGVARRLDLAGADGLVLFNRLYQPDFDIEALEVKPVVHLSSSADVQQRLLWAAALYGRVDASLIVTGGVHDHIDVIKCVMAGADATQLVSAVLREGAGKLTEIKDALATWLETHEYESLGQMRGSMSLLKSPDPESFERANYMRSLQSWVPGAH